MVEKDLDMEEINWMMGPGRYIGIGAKVHPYWQKSNMDVPSGKRYILIHPYWMRYIYRPYPAADFAGEDCMLAPAQRATPVLCTNVGGAVGEL